MVEDEFFEWAEVFGHRYGTPKAQIRERSRRGRTSCSTSTGRARSSSTSGPRATSCACSCCRRASPSSSSACARAGTDSDAVIHGRMDRARAEISHWDAYDYVVINDDIEACFAKVKMILEAERMRRLRQTGLIDFVRELRVRPPLAGGDWPQIPRPPHRHALVVGQRFVVPGVAAVEQARRGIARQQRTVPGEFGEQFAPARRQRQRARRRNRRATFRSCSLPAAPG